MLLARTEKTRLLPQGLAAKDNDIFEIQLPQVRRNRWLSMAAALNRGVEKVAYLYQLCVLSEFRRQGLRAERSSSTRRWPGKVALRTVIVRFGRHRACSVLALFVSAGLVLAWSRPATDRPSTRQASGSATRSCLRSVQAAPANVASHCETSARAFRNREFSKSTAPSCLHAGLGFTGANRDCAGATP